MTPFLQTGTHWQRLHADSPQALAELACQHGLALPSHGAAGADAPDTPDTLLRIRCIRLERSRDGVQNAGQTDTLRVCDLLWRTGADNGSLLTVETGHRMLRPGAVQARLRAQQWPPDSAHAVALALLHQLLEQTAQVLDRIDQSLGASWVALRSFQRSVGTDHACGAEDMVAVDARLSMLHAPSALVVQALADLEHAARRLRRAVCLPTALPARLSSQHVDDLIAAIAGVQQRARFTFERQRFHWRAAGEAVAMSDLSVTKVFTVLWAAFIPGTALVNWYGQNFQVMPELSWTGSLWTQLLAVLVLTAIPLWMVKRTGALR